jgi:hypothetical protein
MDLLVAQVNISRPLPVRIAAVHKIIDILEAYSLRNVMGLWAEASDLLLPEQSADTAEVGLRLLKSLAALPDLTAVERNVFFGAAFLRTDLGHRLDIVSALTNGGRALDACEPLIAPFVLQSLDSCFDASHTALKVARKTSNAKKAAHEPLKESENMQRLFQYTIDVCKFNSKVFMKDDCLEQLLIKAMGICQSTTQHADISNVVRLFDTIITYLHIPKTVLKPCLEVLCSIHRQLLDLQEQTWNTLTNLFKSHFGQAAVSALLHTLLEGAERKSHQQSVYRGAIQVLQLLLLEDGRAGLPKVPLSVLIPALKSSIKEEHVTQETIVVGMIAAVLEEERMRNVLLNEANWADLIDIIRTCAGRDDTREAARTAGTGAKLAVNLTPSAGGTPSLTTGWCAPRHVVYHADWI